MFQPDELSTVALVRLEDPIEATRKALSLIHPKIDVKPGDRVLIKPNCVRPKRPSTGVTTDSRIVEAIVEYLKDRGVSDITIAEGGNPGTDRAFRLAGLKALSESHDLNLVNLNEDEWEEVPVPGGVALKKVRIARTVLGSTCIINVPKLKVHHMAQVTLSLKNFMGAIVGNRGEVMHHRLDEKIVDLASLFKPTLNVIDGTVGAEMDEVVGSPVSMNVVVAGADMVATDAVGSAVMGFDPHEVRHVQMAAERGLGTGDLDRIRVLGDSIESVRKRFSREYSDEKLRSYGLTRPLTGDDVARMKVEFEGRDPRVRDPYAR
jgi:uncharacterized protein (DUF362 family)